MFATLGAAPWVARVSAERDLLGQRGRLSRRSVCAVCRRRAGRQSRPRWSIEPGHRGRAVRQCAHGRIAPHAELPKARREVPIRTHGPWTHASADRLFGRNRRQTPCSPDLIGHMNEIHHWIDGRVVESVSGRSAPVYNPATGEQSGVVDLASVDEVDQAVAVAAAAASRGARPACRSAPRSCSAPANSSTPTAKRSPGCSPQSTARCSATPWVRSPAVWRTSSSLAACRTC